jgi:hypothetical protein
MIVHVNLFGLILNAIGSGLLIKYPPCVSILTELGELNITFVANAPPDGNANRKTETRRC